MNIDTLKNRLKEYEAVYLAQGQEISNLETRLTQAKADRNAQAGAIQALRAITQEWETEQSAVVEKPKAK